MYRSTNHLRPGLADFGQACGMAVLRTNLDAAPGLDVGLELHSRPGPNLRWNGVVEIQASMLTGTVPIRKQITTLGCYPVRQIGFKKLFAPVLALFAFAA